MLCFETPIKIDNLGSHSIFTARVRSTREGNVLTRVCPSINLSVHRGGVPISHNALQHFPECHEAVVGGYPYPIMLCNISQNAMRQRRGGVPISHNALQHFPECHEVAGGTRVRVPPLGGTRVRYPPGGVLRSGYPPGGYPGQGTPRGVPGSGYPPGGVPGSSTPPGGYPGQGTPRGGTRVRYPPGGGTQVRVGVPG